MNPKLKRASWILFGMSCLLFFTAIKLPREPIKDSIRAGLGDALGPYGITLNATDEDLSFFLIPSYRMRKVTVSLPPPADPTQLDEVSVSPRFLPLLLGRVGADLRVDQGGGTMKGSFASNGKSYLSASMNFEKIDLGRLGILPLLAGLQASSVLDGSASFSGDLQTFNSADAGIDLKLSKMVIEPQNISGLAIPKLTISEGAIRGSVQQGKFKISALYLGKPGPSISAADDIQAVLSGEITLGKTLESSTLNLRAKFSFSQNFLKSFMLLDALLGNGKQPDGSYAFSLTGPLTSPVPQPISPGGGT